MNTTIRVGAMTATVNNGAWSGEPLLAEAADLLTRLIEHGGYIHDLDLYKAEHVVEQMGGEIIANTPVQLPDPSVGVP